MTSIWWPSSDNTRTAARDSQSLLSTEWSGTSMDQNFLNIRYGLVGWPEDRNRDGHESRNDNSSQTAVEARVHATNCNNSDLAQDPLG